MARADPQFNIRLPKDLLNWLHARAALNRRNSTAEITKILSDLRDKEPGDQPDESSPSKVPNDSTRLAMLGAEVIVARRKLAEAENAYFEAKIDKRVKDLMQNR